jgi:hypothetical protein
MTTPYLMIATPCFGGLVTQLYMTSVLRLIQSAPNLGFGTTLAMLGYDSLVPRARATLVGAFLDNPEATHLLFIDADIGFDPDQVVRLLSAQKDFAAALYPVKSLDWEQMPERCTRGAEPLAQGALNYVGTFATGDKAKRDGDFATASYAGGGFQLIRRSVIEKLIEAYPQTKFSKLLATPTGERPAENLYALFDTFIDQETGEYLSEDYAFCRRWRDTGGEIWLDRNSRLTHTGVFDYRGDHSSRLRTLDNLPPI